MGLSDAGPIPYALALSAAIQLALLAPLIIAIVRRRALAASPRTARVGSLLPGAVIVVLTALSLVTVATPHPLVHF
jgi:hypothetical protein